MYYFRWMYPLSIPSHSDLVLGVEHFHVNVNMSCNVFLLWSNTSHAKDLNERSSTNCILNKRRFIHRVSSWWITLYAFSVDACHLSKFLEYHQVLEEEQKKKWQTKFHNLIMWLTHGGGKTWNKTNLNEYCIYRDMNTKLLISNLKMNTIRYRWRWKLL